MPHLSTSYLFAKAKTTVQKAHAQDKEEVCKDGPQQRRLYDPYLILQKKNLVEHSRCRKGGGE